MREEVFDAICHDRGEALRQPGIVRREMDMPG
jgi:hypothetical protein